MAPEQNIRDPLPHHSDVPSNDQTTSLDEFLPV
jgi:hypothetical protein